VTVAEGLAGLAALQALLTRRELRARVGALARAASWISSRPPAGAGHPGLSGFTNRGTIGSVARIDVAIFSGVNFVQ